jgi:hypothetical protein
MIVVHLQMQSRERIYKEQAMKWANWLLGFAAILYTIPLWAGADKNGILVAGIRGNSPVVSGVPLKTVIAARQNIAGSKDQAMVQPAAPSAIARIYVKVWLEGPYDAASNTMVRTAAYKAILDTLKRDWNTKFLTGDITAPITTVVPNALDFILVYMRSTGSGVNPVAQNIGILATNGFLYDLNGDPGISMNVRNGDYHIILLHRNHLAVQSNGAVNTATLTGNNPGQYWDFTDIANCYHATGWINNEPVKLLEENVYGLFAGNAAGAIGHEPGAAIPKVVYSLDMAPIQAESGDNPKYTRADTNMNGIVVQALDASPIQLNSGIATEAPMPINP